MDRKCVDRTQSLRLNRFRSSKRLWGLHIYSIVSPGRIGWVDTVNTSVLVQRRTKDFGRLLIRIRVKRCKTGDLLMWSPSFDGTRRISVPPTFHIDAVVTCELSGNSRSRSTLTGPYGRWVPGVTIVPHSWEPIPIRLVHGLQDL